MSTSASTSISCCSAYSGQVALNQLPTSSGRNSSASVSSTLLLERAGSSSSYNSKSLNSVKGHQRQTSTGSSSTSTASSKRAFYKNAHAGIDVFKVSKSGKVQPRRIGISNDNRTLYVTTNKIKSIRNFIQFAKRNTKSAVSIGSTGSGGGGGASGSNVAVTANCIDITTIDRIYIGQQNTPKFELAKRLPENNSSSSSSNINNERTISLSLSIVYRVRTDEMSFPNAQQREPHQFDTLDVIIQNKSDYHDFITSLSDLIKISKRVDPIKFSNNVLCLQYHWIDTLGKEMPDLFSAYSSYGVYVDSNNAETMDETEREKYLLSSASEFVQLCDKLNIGPIKKPLLVKQYKEYCALHNISSDGGENERRQVTGHKNKKTGLTIQQTNELLEEIFIINKEKQQQKEGNNQEEEYIHPIDKIWNDIYQTDPVPPLSQKPSSRNNYDDEHIPSLEELELEIDKEDNKEETISSVAFLSFVRSHQKEYKTQLEDVLRLFKFININFLSFKECSDIGNDDNSTISSGGDNGHDGSNSNNERICKSKFIAYMMSDTNDLMSPTKGMTNSNDMNHPLSCYYINTSHASYLAAGSTIGGGGSATSPSSGGNNAAGSDAGTYATNLQMYESLLYRGVRCLELMTWDPAIPNTSDEKIIDDVIIAYRRSTTGSNSGVQANKTYQMGINFKDILIIIRNFIKSSYNNDSTNNNPKNKSSLYPIILNIENHCSLKYQDIMAYNISKILGTEGMLYETEEYFAATVDEQGENDEKPLPSPSELRGKVIIKCKRPRVIKNGSTVINDDFDDENDLSMSTYRHGNNPMGVEGNDTETDDGYDTDYDDDDDDDENEENGFVVGFNAAGPIKSDTSDITPPSAVDLFGVATRDLDKAKSLLRKADERSSELEKDATEAERLAAKLMKDAGVTRDDLKVVDEGVEMDLDLFQTKDKSAVPEEESECVEVQDFFDSAVNNADTSYNSAHREAIEASKQARVAENALRESEKMLKEAENDLEESHKNSAEKSELARRAAQEARERREHSDEAKQRIETVRALLQESRDKTSSAENVVVTAEAEAKISEERARAHETRAARAQAVADKERARADEETKKEVQQEKEANEIHDQLMEATREADESCDRMEKAASTLGRINEQIKLIETSTQYHKEKTEAAADYSKVDLKRTSSVGSSSSRGRFVSKLQAKEKERSVCAEMIRDASEENKAAEMRKLQLRKVYDEKCKRLKKQADLANVARRKADRSSAAAEELAEHAEEEREAANLRKTARDKAQMAIHDRDATRKSLENQLAEAERASIEADYIAAASRKRAEELAKDATMAKDHTRELHIISERNKEREEAKKAYEAAMDKKENADAKAYDAKRLRDTSSEVLSTAQRNAAAEKHRENVELVMRRDAANAYSNARVKRQNAEEAARVAAFAAETVAKKAAACKHASEYKKKMERVVLVSPKFAQLTFLHSGRHKSWLKSMILPNTHSHSLPQGFVEDMRNNRLFLDGCVNFTKSHMCRTFPQWSSVQRMQSLNYDPVYQWSLGFQLVSMNFHTTDEYLLLNDGRFRQNGSCGYVLKPQRLLDGESLSSEQKQRWRIRVLSGSHLPKPESSTVGRGLQLGGSSMHYVNPRVRVTLYDGTRITAQDQDQYVKLTKVSKKNGYDPVWDEEDFNFEVKMPSLAVLLFTVWDKRNDGTDDFIAGAAIPVSCMREGFRSLALFDSINTRCGPYAFSSLFVRSQKIA